MVGRGLRTRETGSPCAWSPGDPWETGVGDSGAATGEGRAGLGIRPQNGKAIRACRREAGFTLPSATGVKSRKLGTYSLRTPPDGDQRAQDF